MTRFQKLAVAAAVVAYLLIVLGGVVRVSGSGMACGGDWPTCGGRLLPALGAPTAIEYAHRAVAGALTLLALGLGVAG
ncbi:MAG: COX15/CtaA family protein, partial [Thermomicrobiaceae bacterium]|nr:COX15/CtaA family protein [Thermomicrobiaceae bacterium]